MELALRYRINEARQDRQVSPCVHRVERVAMVASVVSALGVPVSETQTPDTSLAHPAPSHTRQNTTWRAEERCPCRLYSFPPC